jgi:hypothetical protein
MFTDERIVTDFFFSPVSGLSTPDFPTPDNQHPTPVLWDTDVRG